MPDHHSEIKKRSKIMKNKLVYALITFGILTSMSIMPVAAAELDDAALLESEEVGMGAEPFDAEAEIQSRTPAPEFLEAFAKGWTDRGDSAYLYKTIDNITYALYVFDGTIKVDISEEASGKIKIPASIDGYPVTEVGQRAFMYNDNITEVILPEGIVRINCDAFSNCTSLTHVQLPNTLKIIENEAFWDNGHIPPSALKQLTIPASVEQVGISAFDAVNLTDITFEGNAPEILYTSEMTGYSLELYNNPIIHVYSNTTGWDADNWKVLNLDIIPNGEPPVVTPPTEQPAPPEDKPSTEQPAPPAQTKVYPDVNESDWFYPYVKDVTEKGLMSGYSDGTFGAYDNLGRGQFATILYRMESQPEITYDAKFPDVADGQFYTKPVLWASQNGIVTGYSATGTFGPADKITREQLAVMMYRYAKYKGYDTTQRADLSRFPDAGSVSEFAQEAMSWSVANKIITGDNHKLNPQGDTARAVCATMMSRYTDTYQ